MSSANSRPDALMKEQLVEMTGLRDLDSFSLFFCHTLPPPPLLSLQHKIWTKSIGNILQ